MNTISISPEKDTYQDLVATLADLRAAGYGLVIADGRLMLDFPTLLLENSNEEELKKMSEITAELNIRCQELGISFIDGTKIPSLEITPHKIPPRPDIGDLYFADTVIETGFCRQCKMEPWAWKGFKGNPTDNSTWKPTKVRKGYGHNKLKGKNK